MDNAMAVAYLNHQGGPRSSAFMDEASRILLWPESHVPALSTVHIPEVENWMADFLSCGRIDQGAWASLPQIFSLLYDRWGHPDVYLIPARFNHKTLC